MSTDTGEESTTRAPDDAFAVLGNETRMEILQTLGEADDQLSFSELRDRVGMRDSGQFNYHLDQLEGHFVRKSEGGYRLRQAGRRVIEAVLSGAVTQAPVVEPTQIDEACPYCGSSIEVGYMEGRIDLFCPDCTGMYGRVGDDQKGGIPADYGYLGAIPLPPAGALNRSPTEMTQAATTWGNLQFLSASTGVCPRCSAPFDESLLVCETHDPADGVCEDCGHRYAVRIRHRCPNCKFDEIGAFWIALVATTDFLSFVTDHGINPISPSPENFLTIISTHDEEVHSVEPFNAEFTYTIDGDAITLTVDDDLNVVDVIERNASDPA